ncbi:DUF2232 domain-containing protein [Clostridium sp. UBA1353]|uniref:DUF2232 domain-containing protein n=1 Tax=Clostridium sp. UBA1353 TaxID=1946347 RepID=UPI00321738EA
MEQKINTKNLIEAALMTGIITIISISASYILLFYIIGLILLPILVALIYYRNGIKYSIGAVLISTILVATFLNPILAIISGMSYGIIGVVLGYCLKNQKKTYNILIALIIACIIAMLVEVWLTSRLVSNIGVIQFINDKLNTYMHEFKVYITQTKEIYSNMGMNATQLQMFEQIESIFTVELLAMLIPTVLFIASFIQAYSTILFTHLIFRKLKYKEVKYLRFSEFYVSNLVGAALIAIISICAIVGSRGITGSLFLYNAILMLTIMILAVNGAAVTDYYFRKKLGMPKAMRILLVILLFIIGSSKILGIVGFVEMMLDFRKLDPYRIRKA